MEASRAALEHFRLGRIDAAEQASLKALRRQPRDTRALAVLGLVHNARGAYRDAAAVFQRLTKLEPTEIPHWVNWGTALRADGDFERALAAYRQALALGDEGPSLLFNLGLLHLDRTEYSEAQTCLARACARAPRDAELRYHFARSCYYCVLNDEARAALRGWQVLEGWTVTLLAELGTLLLQLGDTTEAESVLRLALDQAPDDVRVRLRLIQLDERNNRLEQACAAFAQLAQPVDDGELAAEFLQTEALLAQRTGNHAEARNKYHSLASQAAQIYDRQSALFQLAKAHDALGDQDAAFSALLQAHQAQMEFLQQSAARFQAPERDPLAIANYSCDAADVAKWELQHAPRTEQSPIFIVAFPRSGTTLLEQMLDAHPQLQSMDEQPFLQNAIDHMAAFGPAYPEQLGQLNQAQLDRTREHYWSLVSSKVTLAPRQRLVDKNPLNLLRLPAIRRLFPQARVIVAIRHPCDVVLSCFMQHFRAPDFAILCSSLHGLAHGYRRAFDFWYQQAALLGPVSLEVRYESFVGEFESHARGIAEFLQLPWDDAMLDPSRHARERGFISTPSYSQVVQPVSTRAVGRWRRYARHFDEAIVALQPYLQRWRYEV
ncbi:MAG: hypothetical protein JWR16_10 [Nevskia sp.]|nr:hypothetical protein [Nevskia sp.]